MTWRLQRLMVELLRSLRAAVGNQRARSEAYWVILHKMATMVMTFLALKAFTNLLTKETFGEWRLVMTGGQLVACLCFMPMRHTYLRVFHQAEMDGSVGTAGIFALRWYATGTCLFAVLAAIVTLPCSRWFGFETLTVVAAATFIVANEWRVLGTQVLEMRRKRRSATLQCLVYLVGHVVLAVLFVWLHWMLFDWMVRGWLRNPNWQHGFLIPLFALLLGVFSFLTNAEYLDMLITQPVPRSQVLLGRYFGLVITVLGASVLGFGLPGIIIALVIGVEGALSYLLVICYSILLAIAFTGISVLITLLSGRRQIALGIALAIWIFYELLYGVLMLGTTLYLSPAVLKVVLSIGLLGNPIDIARVLSLLQVGGPHLFGPAGATLIKMTGSSFLASMVGLAGLLIWVVVPVLISIRIFKKQDL